MSERVGNIALENVRIIFKNFSGKETKFNPAGKRNFCVVIDDNDIASGLIVDGWNVRTLPARDEDEEPTHYMQVSFTFGNYPPDIYLVKGDIKGGKFKPKSKVRLDEDSIDILDYMEIESCDIVIRPYQWQVRDASGIKAYVKTMYVTVLDDDFAFKYDPDIDDEVPFN